MSSEIQEFNDESVNVGFVGDFFYGVFGKCCFKEQRSVKVYSMKG